MIRKNPMSMILLFLCCSMLLLTACNSNDASTSDSKESKKELDKYEKCRRRKC